MNKIFVKSKMHTGKIERGLHGQFIEFLGSGIYDGIWVGEDSDIANYEGLRKDVVDALKEIQPPILRWPGGCYADTYHWKKGIGPKNERPYTFNENFGTEEIENNHFGTHEFMKLCNLVGAKPWFNINMMSGTVEEMNDWAEYCNRPNGTELSDMRIKNGAKEPFNVEYWGIGNESWAGGGTYTAQSYADSYRRFASAFPRFGAGLPWSKGQLVPIKLIAVGPDGNKPKERVEWTKKFFESLGDFRQPKLDGYDLHFYNWNMSDSEDTVTEFSEAAWYRVINSAFELEEIICEQYDLIQEGIKNIPQTEGPFSSEMHCDLIVGEWGNWHNIQPDSLSVLWQQCTMRDALTTALTLDIFHRNCDKVKMACVAQSVNVLNSLFLTKDAETILTPNYHVFNMYKVHQDATRLECEINSTKVNKYDYEQLNTIYSFASEKDGLININVVNVHMTDSINVELGFDQEVEFVSVETLKSNCVNDCNTFADPKQVVTSQGANPIFNQKNGIFKIEVPAASVSVYQFKVK